MLGAFGSGRKSLDVKESWRAGEGALERNTRWWCEVGKAAEDHSVVISVGGRDGQCCSKMSD